MGKLSFTVIGISDASQPEFSDKIKEQLATNKYFSGGNRHYELVKSLLPSNHIWLPVSVPLNAVYAAYRQITEPIIVFASGDPLFFGFGATLLREFPDCEIQVIPQFNSIQMLAQKAVIPYQSIYNVSLTGRPWHAFDRALIKNEPLIGILTDRKKTPQAIARYMLQYGYANYTVIVGEYLGGSRERIIRCSVAECAEMQFADLNCMVIQQTVLREKSFGIPETDFAGLPGRPNMITKAPYRLISLSKLNLHNATTFWDIGFCTGSVSIEAKLQFPHLQVFAFEKRSESAELIETNMARFGTPGIDYRIGDFFDCQLDEIPAPDSVFIGGHGGRLFHLLEIVAQRLTKNGIVVINAVNADSQVMFIESCKELGLTLVDDLTISLDSHNPLRILTAKNI